MNKRDLISKSPIFSAMNRKAIADLAAISQVIEIHKGEFVFAEDDEADALYILAEGEVDLVKYGADGREHFVRCVKAGETFAEAAMFAGELYPVSAVVGKAGRIIAIPRARFHTFVRKHPEASIAMLGAMARLLRHWSDLLTELSLMSVESRIAAWLIRQYRKTGEPKFSIEMKKRDLAFRLGTVPETLSRNLRRFMKMKLIGMAGDEIIIKDLESLEDIAAG